MLSIAEQITQYSFTVETQYKDYYTKVLLKYPCGHTHETMPSSINRGFSVECKECFPQVAHNLKDHSTFTKELEVIAPSIKVLSNYVASKQKITIEYPCKHTYEVIPNSLLMGQSLECPICTGNYGSKSKTHSTFIEEIKELHPSLEVIGEYKNGTIRIPIKYPCGCTHSVIPNSLVQGKVGRCPTCSPKGISKGQEELIRYIQGIYTRDIIIGDRTILEGKELDIVLPDIGLAIEYNGEWFHRECDVRPANYHLNKTLGVESIEYQLIHIMEKDWVNKQDIIKSRLANLLGKSTRTYARHLQVKEVTWAIAQEYLNTNHLQGAGAPAKVCIALVEPSGNILSMATFGTPRFTKEYSWELLRLSGHLGTLVVGGPSKLLHFFEQKYSPDSIVSYADRTWSKGKVYYALGFKLSHTSPPRYSYHKGNTSVSRYQAMKHKLKDLLPDVYSDSKTEKQIMEEAGYYRVFDSGNLVFVKEYK
jgi:hypothetical protein